mmetsp:Transcript_6589/g.19883  ORF Transcript_6589/g.19883 Transcript_6589/m.19883 type:complete len:238 (+) Transcript_6589:1426-2139(+)
MLAQRSRQHGDDAVNQVGRGGARCRLGVKRRARHDVVRHVRNVHAHLGVPVLELSDGKRVVEVARCGRVDGADAPAAAVAARCVQPPAGGAKVDGCERLALRQVVEHLRREFCARHVKLVQDGLCLRLERANAPQDGRHAAHGHLAVLRPAHEVACYLTRLGELVQPPLALWRLPNLWPRAWPGAHRALRETPAAALTAAAALAAPLLLLLAALFVFLSVTKGCLALRHEKVGHARI